MEGLDLKTAEFLEAKAQLPWNPSGKPEVWQWLQQQQESGAPDRLKAMGNIVIPAQCQLALQILSHADMKC